MVVFLIVWFVLKLSWMFIDDAIWVEIILLLLEITF